MNYIKKLEGENAELKRRVDNADAAIRELRSYLNSPKFNGNPQDPLHMYVNVKDVEHRLNIIESNLYNL